MSFEAPSRFSTDHSKAVPLLQYFLFPASVVSYIAFILSLFVPHLSLRLCLVRTVLRDCGISWVFSAIC